MRRMAVVLVATCVLASLAQMPGTAAVAARCRLVASVDGPTLTIRYRLWNGGARDDWRVKFYREDERVYQRIHRTSPEGRFRVVRRYENHPGRENITGSARHLQTGAVCRVTVRV
jgi:hypothetical protein